MKAVIQRVSSASVTVEGKVTGSIEGGLCVFLGVSRTDSDKEAEWLADKIVNLRVFEDDGGKMNRSLLETGGALLAVSQFTLYGNCTKGRRPSFISAGDPDEANRLYEVFKKAVAALGVPVESGIFQTHMMVQIINDGPVTLLLEREREGLKTEGCEE